MSTTASFDNGLALEEQRLVVNATDFARNHLALNASFDSAGHRELLRLACGVGLAGIEVPVESGGAGASFSARMRVCEELARTHPGFAFSLVNHHNIVSRIALSGQPSVKRDLVPAMLEGALIGCTAMTEPQSGSDFAGMQTTATRTQDGWRLNGAKAWITNASLADVFLVYAQTDAAAGAAGIAGFIVLAEDAGFIRGDAYKATGVDGMAVGQFSLEDCRVPEERVLYPAPGGFKAALRGVNQARVHVAAMNAAMVENAMNTALRHASSRQAFGKSIVEFQGVGWSLADVATHLHAMRLLAYVAAEAIDSNHDAQVSAAMAKKYANDHAASAISTCMQVMGARGITDEVGLARLLGWAKAFCYTDGTPEMMNERIVRALRKNTQEVSMQH